MALDGALRPLPERSQLSATPVSVALARLLGHTFADPGLLDRALTHSSAAAGSAPDRNNERLEFLGDRVLGLVVAEALVQRFPKEPEGDLARRQAHLVARDSLAAVAREIGLEKHLVVAEGNPAAAQTPSMLADALEAVIAALYLDGGLEAARAFVLPRLEPLMDTAVPRDPKTSLQEWSLGRSLGLPHYLCTNRSGPDHDPIFDVTVTIADKHQASGTGRSKRAAEQEAAKALLDRLRVKS